jgi:hypothetical protein
MVITGNIKEVLSLLRDISACHEKVSDFIDVYAKSDATQKLIRTLYPRARVYTNGGK